MKTSANHTITPRVPKFRNNQEFFNFQSHIAAKHWMPQLAELCMYAKELGGTSTQISKRLRTKGILDIKPDTIEMLILNHGVKTNES